ncbi:MAG: hypothetical protein SNJ77_06085, partial [Cytophagales bacterium]
LSQSVYVPVNADYHHLIDRLEIKSGKLSNEIFTTHKALSRHSIVGLTDTVFQDSLFKMTSKDRFNISYLRDDNWEWADSGDSKKSLIKHFFKKKNALLKKELPEFILIANPVLHLSAGREPGKKYETIYQNTRGAEIRGHLDNKIGFYALMTENQVIFPEFARILDTVPLVYGENYSKRTAQKPQISDFLSARAYVTGNLTKHWSLQFGHDKHFVGNGMRSLLLSDHAGSYLFARSMVKIWKFQYMNLFAQMTATPTINDSYYRKKYFAMHHLSVNLTKNINIGVFEIVNFGRPNNGGFDFNYLNPIIFYRSVEQNLGSYDNAMLGFDWKINFLRHFSFYGQVLLDELLVSKVRERKGDWVNKQALQTGLKYIDVFGIGNLDIAGEFNYVRPFVYQHLDLERSHAHYLQPLAHPAGANFAEWVAVARYQPLKRVFVTAKTIILRQGVDTLGSNFNVGADVRKSYNDRIEPDGVGTTTGHKVGQGIDRNLIFANFTCTFMAKHNVFFDLSITSRAVNSAKQSELSSRTSLFSLAFRWNITQRRLDF